MIIHIYNLIYIHIYNIVYICIVYIYIYIYIYIYSRHADTMVILNYLAAIALVRSSRRHSVSAQSRWIYDFAGQPTLVCPCLVVHRKMSLISLPLLLLQCPACLFHLNWIVCVNWSKWPHSIIQKRNQPIIPLSIYLSMYHTSCIYINWSIDLSIKLSICCDLTKSYWIWNKQNRGWKWNRSLYNLNKIQSLLVAWRR